MNLKQEIEIFYNDNVIVKDYEVYGGECTMEIDEVSDPELFKLNLEKLVLRLLQSNI
ncbi:hypothetical protein MUK51_10880 [Sphingobacterium faecium]|uniref:hypothetical protein n=1 Tax=Sphingobacterium faecium TaxID=34087 RepID=UPI0021B5C884|nr:hypothetical protein [Sphingobacterium faecium]UXD67735.1 hypothetical protein MUK51_10880 [Sphingobacterium faecium]